MEKKKFNSDERRKKNEKKGKRSKGGRDKGKKL